MNNNQMIKAFSRQLRFSQKQLKLLERMQQGLAKQIDIMKVALNKMLKVKVEKPKAKPGNQVQINKNNKPVGAGKS